MKRIFLYSAGLLLLAAGCTKTEKVPSGEEWVWDESLPVPISFESGGGLDVETRAAITSLEGIDIGLFAMSVDKNDNNLPVWNYSDPATRLLVNKKVQTNEEGTIIVEDEYYPNDNKYNYSFYAYAPYTEEDCEEGSDWQRITFTLGDTDIIYGESHAAVLGDGTKDNYFGFKASYIRFVKGMQDERKDLLPNMTFKHMLTGLTFYAQLASSSTDVSGESNVTIKTIEILNTAKTVALYVADKNRADGDLSGTIEQRGDPGSVFVGGGENVLKAKLMYGDYNESAGPIGQVFLLPGDSFDISVTYEIATGGEPKVEEVAATIDRSQWEGFAAGNNYTVKLKITSPERMEIITKLDDWKDKEHGEVPMV